MSNPGGIATMNVGRSKVLNIFDGGIQKARNKRPLGIIIFNITTSEGKPENIIGYCHPNYRDSIIKTRSVLSFRTWPLRSGRTNPKSPFHKNSGG